MRTMLSLAILLLATGALGQGLPRRTECLQWDQAYAQAAALGIGGAAILSLVLGLTIGFLFGRQFWWAASPRKRIGLAGAVAFALMNFVVVIWPRALPLGRFFYASVDPRYPDCQTMSFGAPGLLGGLIGQGVAAYGQWQAISLLLLGATGFGTLVAWVVSEGLVRNRGLEAVARGGEA